MSVGQPSAGRASIQPPVPRSSGRVGRRASAIATERESRIVPCRRPISSRPVRPTPRPGGGAVATRQPVARVDPGSGRNPDGAPHRGDGAGVRVRAAAELLADAARSTCSTAALRSSHRRYGPGPPARRTRARGRPEQLQLVARGHGRRRSGTLSSKHDRRGSILRVPPQHLPRRQP